MEPGQLIDQRYEVIRLLGTGAMASVYEARHTSLHSVHAIKLLNLELAQNPDLRSRFLSEGRIQAQLRHPNIVSVSDIVTDPAPGLVMELVQGGAMDEYLQATGAITEPGDVLAMFLPILDAVGAAHLAGIVHRDLKPENILMGTDIRGQIRPVVADFGIARILDENQISGSKRETEMGAQMGTVLYMSPEQVHGESVDTRSDIFALGAILYEILTNQVAFDAPSQYMTMRRITEGDLPKRTLVDIEPAFAACIRKALAVSPGERFQSCTEFQEALVTAVQGGETPPGSPSRSHTVNQVSGAECSTEPLTAMPRHEPEQEPPPAAVRLPVLDRAQPLYAPVNHGMPWSSALVNGTMLLTGVGQMMNGQYGKGLVIFTVHWSLALFTCFVTMPFTAMLASLDAWMIGRKQQRGRHTSAWEFF